MADFKEEVLHLLEKRDTKETTVFNDLFTKCTLLLFIIYYFTFFTFVSYIKIWSVGVFIYELDFC